MSMFVIGAERMPRRMASFGASGTCVQVALDLSYQAGEQCEFVGYIADSDARSVNADGFPIVGLDEASAWGDVGVFVPIHDPGGRRVVFDRLTSAELPILGASGTPHLAHPTAHMGEGVIVGSLTRVGPDTQLGRGVIAISDLVAHDVVVGEFTTLAMHSVVLGHVRIGANVFIGAGAVVKNGTARRPLVIGDGAVIGAGAVIDRDVAPGEALVAPSAMSLRERALLTRLFRRPRGNE